MSLYKRIVNTGAARAVILIRLIVGGVFLTEGIQKFLFADEVGVGRFVKMGIPSPEFTAPFVGIVETVCGVLILLGLFTRLAAIQRDAAEKALSAFLESFAGLLVAYQMSGVYQ